MISRRRLLQLGLAAATVDSRALAQAGPWLELKPDRDSFVLTHAQSGDSLRISRRAPVFEFDGFSLGGSVAGEGTWRTDDLTWTGTWRVTTPRAAEIVTILTLDPGRLLLHRTALVHLLDGPTALLKAVVLDEIDTTGKMPTVRGALQSYPALFPSFFVGVEFPIAFTEMAGQLLHIGHRPGRRIASGGVFRSRRAVYGSSVPGKSREAFESYISAMRPAPRGLHFNYNSWWTSPVPYTEKDILDLIRQFRTHLFEPYGVSPDTFCIDMGWAKNTTLWQIDPALFPDGFRDVRAACDSIRSRPGLWISPSGVYGQALDLKWAHDAGYEADTKACLGGPKYRAAFADALLDHAARFGIGHVKFDGYVPTCDATDHGHEPGALSAERIAEGMLYVFTSLRQAAPDLWMEPTCFGFDPSPWWLPYVNSVIGTFGDDAPHGRVPCPVYRNSYTSARDFYNLQGAHDILAPIAAQEVLGIVHQTNEDLHDDAIVTVLRGHEFIPLYLNPSFMSPRRWEFMAALMLWARKNANTLSLTRPIDPARWQGRLDKPMERTPYGYAHWWGGRGLVCLRNPWIEPATFDVSLADHVGAAADGPRVGATLIYPERRTLAASLAPSDRLQVALAPYETVLIELGEPRKATVAPVRTEPPAYRVSLRPRAAWFQADASGPRFGPDYTRIVTAEGPVPRMRLAGEIDVPQGDRHELLILVEGPRVVDTPYSRILVNGSEATPGIVASEAGWRAAGGDPPEHWLWLVVPLIAGRSTVDVDLILADGAHTVACWVAGRRRIAWRKLPKVTGDVLPPPEERWTGAVRAFEPVSFGDSMSTERGPAPVVRIDGVYLDTVEPVETHQGWGKLERNQSVWEKPMTVDGKRYLRGLGTHAPSLIAYALDGKYVRFRAWAGADQATNPTITMEVRVDGKVKWKSGPIVRGTPAHRLDIDIRNARRLELIVGDGGNGLAGDHADWADAMLLR